MTINDALALHHAGRLAEAERAYRQVLALQPNQYHALHFLGVLKAQTGDFAASVDFVARSLALFAKNPLAEFHLAESLSHLGRYRDAASHYRKAIDLDAGFVPAYGGLAVCLMEQGAPHDALDAVRQGLQHAPQDPDLESRHGEVLRALKCSEEAKAAYQRVLQVAPGHMVASLGLGRLLCEAGRYQDGLQIFETQARHAPHLSEPHIACAFALAALGRRPEALEAYQHALAADPNNPAIYYSIGCTLMEGNFWAQAVAAFDSALALRPGYVEALYNRAYALAELGRRDEALAACDHVLRLDPKSGPANAKSALLRAQICDWAQRDACVSRLEALVQEKVAIDPFVLAWATDDPALQLQAATAWAVPAAAPMPPRPLSQGRLKIGYLSPNFHEHPVAHQAVAVFEAHDRQAFETFGLCVAPGPQTAIRTRLQQAFDHFIELGQATPTEIAQKVQALGIDILVDLAGYTSGGQTAALRFRPAPIQVSWLGFPGTTGAPYVDYLIADPVLIPPADEVFYSEKIVRLPLSYMPRDRADADAPVPSRPEAGLPQTGLVFAAFNNTLKFTPEVFAVWMRLLSAIPGSVLWLNVQNPQAKANLGRAAQAQAIAPDRLIFAPRIEARAAHLARLSCADLFLDTVPYGAHSTANDFLWAGVPVLTCSGKSFASRVAAAQLLALDLAGLIAPDLAAYERMALDLAKNEEARAGLRRHLARAGKDHPLFDPVRFACDLERSYRQMAQDKGTAAVGARL